MSTTLFQQAEDEALRRIDCRAEFAALGIHAVGENANSDGWISARGIDDANPSCAIGVCNGVAGLYHDHRDHSTRKIWQVAADLGKFPDWKEARKYYCDRAGVALPSTNGKHASNGHQDAAGGEDEQSSIPTATAACDATEAALREWCKDRGFGLHNNSELTVSRIAKQHAGHKPGVTAEACVKAGCRAGNWPMKARDPHLAILFPSIRELGSGLPAGAVIYRADAQIWPAIGSLSERKAHNLRDCKDGWVIVGNQSAFVEACDVWKCEGVPDALALAGILPSGHIAIANTHGCGSIPAHSAKLLRGKVVHVVGDQDTDGAAGAEKFAKSICQTAAETRLLTLPYEMQPKHGKDLRDFIVAGGTWEELHRIDAQARAVLPEEHIDPKAGKKSSHAANPNRPAPTGPNEAVDDPHRLARTYLEYFGTTADEEQKIHFWRDEWHHYRDGAYHPVPEPEQRAALTNHAKAEFDIENAELLKNWVPTEESPDPPCTRKVTTGIVTNTRQALAGMAILSGEIQQPAWIGVDPPGGFLPHEMLATKSGLLHLPSLIAGQPAFLPPTPRFFSPNVVPYEFDHKATCPAWDAFLSTIWPDDPESVGSLQEWFGLALLPDTRHHKLLMILGPKRSGKGTIARTLKSVIGAGNVATPTLASLAGPFGLWPLMNKTLAIVGDARLSGRTDGVAVVERLLSISGEDPQDIHRKNLPTLTGVHMPVRFVILTNELPNMRDASGAMTSRVIMLRMTRSFFGREDKALGNKLSSELPGILNWSIRGWHRLQERGALQQPESARELLDDLDNLASPIAQFVAERCITGPEFRTTVGDLFSEWREWCEQNGRDNHGTVGTFGKDLRATLPQLKTVQPKREDQTRFRAYDGIGLKKHVKGGFGNA